MSIAGVRSSRGDGYQTLARTIAVQDALLAQGIYLMNEWLHDAERK